MCDKQTPCAPCQRRSCHPAKQPDRHGRNGPAATIIETIGAPFDLDGQQIIIGVTIGIAVAPKDRTMPCNFSRPPSLPYRAKSDGRGTYRFFEPAMHINVQARRALERDLHKALTNDEFVVHYQPLVNLQTEQICGFEALIRWNHRLPLNLFRLRKNRR